MSEVIILWWVTVERLAAARRRLVRDPRAVLTALNWWLGDCAYGLRDAAGWLLAETVAVWRRWTAGARSWRDARPGRRALLIGAAGTTSAWSVVLALTPSVLLALLVVYGWVVTTLLVRSLPPAPRPRHALGVFA